MTFTPTINPVYLEETGGGLSAAHADLFKNSLIVITVPPGTEADAMKLACDLAALLGAQTLFTDPLEIRWPDRRRTPAAGNDSSGSSPSGYQPAWLAGGTQAGW